MATKPSMRLLKLLLRLHLHLLRMRLPPSDVTPLRACLKRHGKSVAFCLVKALQDVGVLEYPARGVG